MKTKTATQRVNDYFEDFDIYNGIEHNSSIIASEVIHLLEEHERDIRSEYNPKSESQRAWIRFFKRIFSKRPF